MLTDKYSYDEVKELIRQFGNSNVAQIDLEDKEDGTFALSYLLISDVQNIKSVRNMDSLIRKNLAKRLYISDLLNRYLEKKSLGKVMNFCIHFNIKDTETLELTSSWGYTTLPDSHNDHVDYLNKCLEQYDMLITKLGAVDQQVELYRKTGKGKRCKYEPVTLGDISEVLRKALEEN